jgi:hypothetical protein
MKNVNEFIAICQDSAKIKDWRITHIQLLKQSSTFFRDNLSETGIILIVSVGTRLPILTSWSYAERIADAHKRAATMCVTCKRQKQTNSCLIIWNPSTGTIRDFGFNVEINPVF